MERLDKDLANHGKGGTRIVQHLGIVKVGESFTVQNSSSGHTTMLFQIRIYLVHIDCMSFKLTKSELP